MEEKKFTLRLGEKEVGKISTLKTLSGENTEAGAIKYCIRNFEELHDRYLNEISKNRNLTGQYNELREKVSDYVNSFTELSAVLK